MEGEELYYIKHFLNGIEFYRFVHYIKENPVALYSVSGIYVDKGKSSFGHVFLYTTDLESEGNYSCEVSSEAPLFDIKKSSNSFLQVNVPPKDNPIITGIRFQYATGENITGTCTSARSKPPSILKWYINDREVIDISSCVSFSIGIIK
ncbi:cell adhesion molecule 2-like [Limulus polyphemus]|uniref:Cell adhesion molecule 2-like n=1 Tax=Limulus polyphemus TaxID=6850 RepID=A0ABM1TMT0_LIMPO|nr:cell adhesion molecule 2-like [Limulus polyphemus]